MRTQNQQSEKNHDNQLCFALGNHHQFFTAVEAATRTPDDRIKSIWPFLCNKARAFAATLSPRELANFDEEDVLVELWVYIRERDHLWVPERGQYVSFAGPLVHNCLYGLRERTRTIKSATNTSSRLRKFEQESEDGEMSDSKRRTMESMRRSVAGPANLTEDIPEHCNPESEMIEQDEQREMVLKVINIVRHISYEEASIIGPYLGLWGQSQLSFSEIACKLGKTRTIIRRIYVNTINRLASSLR